MVKIFFNEIVRISKFDSLISGTKFSITTYSLKFSIISSTFFLNDKFKINKLKNLIYLNLKYQRVHRSSKLLYSKMKWFELLSRLHTYQSKTFHLSFTQFTLMIQYSFIEHLSLISADGFTHEFYFIFSVPYSTFIL